ncbi:hypothetical protein K431DRAFT_296908 [Polychaeton citri CBS 116435]|uniref:Uncharacterized protein n=1 Tax=Polychaeton citri CBS 116435 TaxID=1314669 RepID=A0A9P4Q0U1_9PEZI|nr:hypothetical protein K431DRAFT_296908 [Polychaeton citri CBS 116435]
MSSFATGNASQDTDGSDLAQQMVPDYFNPENARLAQKLLEERNDSVDCLASPINMVTIKGYSSLVNFTAVEKLISRCPEQIADLEWDLDKPLTRKLLDAIEKAQPDLRLHYTLALSYWDWYNHEVPPILDGTKWQHTQRVKARKRILGSKNLYSVKGEISYGSKSNYEDLSFVHEVLRTCPNVRKFDIKIMWGGGCVVLHNPWAFNFSKDRGKFPPLEVLKLNGYDLSSDVKGEKEWVKAPVHERDFAWGPLALLPEFAISYLYDTAQHIVLSDRLPFFDTVAYQRATDAASGEQHRLQQLHEPSNLNAWIERMDFSNLKTLELNKITAKVLERLAPVLKSVEHLSLSGRGSVTGQALPEFLRRISRPLVSIMFDLDICEYDDLVTALNETSSGSLKSFRTAGYPNIPALSRLAMECPKIENMNLSVRRIDLKNFREQSYEQDNHGNVQDDEANEKYQPDIHLDFDAIYASAMGPALQHLALEALSPDTVINKIKRTHSWSPEQSRLMHDPDLSRTSVPQLFNEINDRRAQAGMKALNHLKITVGPWDHKGGWGMAGPPSILMGKWYCEIQHDGLTRCYGGNKGSGDYDWHTTREVQDPYSDDWKSLKPVFYSEIENGYYTDGIWDEVTGEIYGGSGEL